jgi:hypothetical protein
MRVSGLRTTPRRRNGHEDLEPREVARAVEETTSPEPVDDQIESLLLDLEEKAEPVIEEPYSPRRAGRERRKRGSARRRHHGRRRVNHFDLYFVVTAVVLGLAIGLLTVLLVNA